MQNRSHRRAHLHLVASTAPATGKQPMLYGGLAFVLLLGVYFGVLTLVSGWPFTLQQFSTFWYYILSLAAGFGVQVGLFVKLRALLNRSRQAGAVVAVSGTASSAAMISCCTHYLVNVAPVLGATGLAALAAQFRVELFWAGLLLNLAGLIYIARKVLKASRKHAPGLA